MVNLQPLHGKVHVISTENDVMPLSFKVVTDAIFLVLEKRVASRRGNSALVVSVSGHHDITFLAPVRSP